MSKYKCRCCIETFSRKDNMQRHIDTYHKDAVNNTTGKFKIKLKEFASSILEKNNLNGGHLENNNLNMDNSINNTTNNNGTMTNNGQINSGPVTNNNNNTNVNFIYPKQYYFTGNDLFDLTSESKGKEAAANYLMYNIKNICPLDIISEYFVNPPNGKSPLDLVDSKTISMRIGENKQVFDTNGKELEKHTKMVLDDACQKANYYGNSNSILLDENKKYTELAQKYMKLSEKNCLLAEKSVNAEQKRKYEEEMRKYAEEMERYERLAEECLDKIRDGTDNLVAVDQLHKNRASISKFKLKAKDRKDLRDKIGEQCLKEGKNVPGMSLSFS